MGSFNRSIHQVIMSEIPAAKYRQFLVAGRRMPSAKDPNPRIYRMRVFAPTDYIARSRFWYFMSKINRLNKTAGEVVALTEVFERKPTVIKNYGVWLRYDSRTGTHNMYKEFRDLTVNGCVTKLYQEMGARHRVRPRSLQIMKISELTNGECKRKQTVSSTRRSNSLCLTVF